MQTRKINLKYISNWCKPFFELIKRDISSNAMEKLLALDPYQSSETFYLCAEEIFYPFCIFDYNFMYKFLYTNFDYVIGYHATKMESVDVLPKIGIKSLKKEEYIDISKDLFGCIISEKEILEAVNCFNDRITSMNIEFAYCKNMFNDDYSCLYLIYGSETLLSIANMLNGNSCRNILRNRNIPIIYKCEIPIQYITDIDKESLFKILFSRCLMKIIDPKIVFSDNSWCFEINQKKLEPKYIKSYDIVLREMEDKYFDHCCYQYIMA